MPKTIEQELKQTRPIGSPHEQAVLGLMRTSRAIEESWQTYLKRMEGISISQYNILRILRGARPKALKSSEIADRMIYRDPDVTRLVDRLSKQGLVSREQDPEDRRAVLVRITDAGLALVARLDHPADQYTKSVMAGLSPDRLRQLCSLLDEVRAGILAFP
ncbi:MAG: MarR family winged helix-turn-helix transcriptional regulator [Gemmatimonadales bacterium]